MNVHLRKPRGVLGIGLVWGSLWALLFAALAVVLGLVAPAQVEGDGPIWVGAIMGAVGLVSGLAFGVYFALVESGKALSNLSLWRAAMGGILASAVYPLVTGRIPEMVVTCTLGMVTAVLLVAIARSDEPPRKTSRPWRHELRARLARLLGDLVSPASDTSASCSDVTAREAEAAR